MACLGSSTLGRLGLSKVSSQCGAADLVVLERANQRACRLVVELRQADDSELAAVAVLVGSAVFVPNLGPAVCIVTAQERAPVPASMCMLFVRPNAGTVRPCLGRVRRVTVAQRPVAIDAGGASVAPR